MNLFLTIAFLFFIGSMAGWVIEVACSAASSPPPILSANG